ncbi:hypothetical protein Taro_015891 [Colocasia esculenta]|uniref:Amino acid transporter transmembrane domain-containing protein n=1 Tax=Colocasia esculenta TaxID=4460 RepID=A0A843UJ32_COLES|nr:hypothetical protein [Colocasia esculenta]
MTHSDGSLFADDDGRVRTGTVWSATAHAVTAIIGSGVLAIPWSVAQLGWVLGPVALLFFSFVSYYSATLLGDCYRHPGPVEGRRNYTYTDAVRAFLGTILLQTKKHTSIYVRISHLAS